MVTIRLKRTIGIILSLSLGISVNAQPTPANIKKEIALEINRFRLDTGQGSTQKWALVQKTALDKAAQIHADWCVKSGQGGHVETRPVAGQPLLPECSDRGKYFGVTVFSEILIPTLPITPSCGAKDRAQLAVETWANSKTGHREAMLMGFPTEVEAQVGVGLAQIQNSENWVIVVVFGANIDPMSGELIQQK